jgi:hypothetical protein
MKMSTMRATLIATNTYLCLANFYGMFVMNDIHEPLISAVCAFAALVCFIGVCIGLFVEPHED